MAKHHHHRPVGVQSFRHSEESDAIVCNKVSDIVLK